MVSVQILFYGVLTGGVEKNELSKYGKVFQNMKDIIFELE